MNEKIPKYCIYCSGAPLMKTMINTILKCPNCNRTYHIAHDNEGGQTYIKINHKVIVK